MLESELADLLSRHGIDPAVFGTGEAKTLQQLLAEVENGEARLVEEDGTVVRHLTTLNVDVYADVEGGRRRLLEVEQCFKDGRGRQRAEQVPASLAEKMKRGEAPEAALRRAMAEELMITKFQAFSAFRDDGVKDGMSQSFPGLRTRNRIIKVDVLIDPAEYKEKYREDQDDKTTYFGWV